MQPIRPEHLSQIEAERPATSDLGRYAPKRLRRHIAQGRRDELGARRPVRREAPPLVTFADSRPLPEVLGIGHGDVGYRRPEFLAPGAGVDIDDRYRPIASCLSEIGRHEEAQALLTDIFAETRDSFGLRDVDTLEAAYSLCTAMVGHEDYAGCVQFFRDFNLIDATARVHGADHEIVLRTRRVYARALYSGENAPLSDVRQAVKILEEICPKTRQVLGPNHPRTSHCERLLMLAQEKLARAEAPVARRTRSKAEES